MKKRPERKGMVFFYMDENGRPTDKGLHDELLERADEIDAELMRLGVIKPPFVLKRIEEDEE